MGRDILLVGAGGALGSILRLLCQKYIQQLYPHFFPLGTLLVNIIGCLIIGVLFGLFERGAMVSSTSRLFLATGFCGGFTTFSSFAYENVTLTKTGHPLLALLYIGLSVVLGLAATWVGMSIAK